jgi:hypothetical protein
MLARRLVISVLVYNLLIIALGSCLGAERARFEIWKKRFGTTRSALESDSTTEQDFLLRIVILRGRVLLNEFDSPTALAKDWANGQEFNDWEDGLVHMAAFCSEVDRLEEALTIANHIRTTEKRQRTVCLVAIRQVQRGDLADAMNVANRLDMSNRDRVIDHVIGWHLQQGDLDEAREKLKLVQGDEMRDRRSEFLDRESRRPAVEDQDFVEKQVSWSLQELRTELEKTKDIRDFFKSDNDPEPSPEQSIGLARNIAEAMHSHHHGRRESCRTALRSAYEAAMTLDNADYRMREVMTLPCIAHKYGEKELAHEMLLTIVTDPNYDPYYVAASFRGLKLMDVMAEVMSNAELDPPVARWQRSESPSEVLLLAATLAARREFDRLEWLYRQLDVPGLRLHLCNEAIAELVQRPER